MAKLPTARDCNHGILVVFSIPNHRTFCVQTWDFQRDVKSSKWPSRPLLAPIFFKKTLFSATVQTSSATPYLLLIQQNNFPE